MCVAAVQAPLVLAHPSRMERVPGFCYVLRRICGCLRRHPCRCERRSMPGRPRLPCTSQVTQQTVDAVGRIMRCSWSSGLLRGHLAEQLIYFVQKVVHSGQARPISRRHASEQQLPTEQRLRRRRAASETVLPKLEIYFCSKWCRHRLAFAHPRFGMGWGGERPTPLGRRALTPAQPHSWLAAPSHTSCSCYSQSSQAQANTLAPPLGQGPAEDVPQNTQDLTIFVRFARIRSSRSCPFSTAEARAGSPHIRLAPASDLAKPFLCAQVQNLLNQMQGRFATMSDAIIGRSERPHPPRASGLALVCGAW
jgi:hypothetical protein